VEKDHCPVVIRELAGGYLSPVRVLAAVLVSALLSACAGEDSPNGSPAPAEDAEAGALDFRNVETISGGLEVPWELAFADEGTILVTERGGRIRVIEDGRVRDEPVAEIDVSSAGEAGLLGLALHPDFADERFAYVYYTSGTDNRVSRFSVGDDFSFGDEEVVLDGIPSASVHDGGRIAFGPDGMLYVGTGDAGEGERAADRGSLAGKILRITPDGSVPDDNPFAGSPVYSYGHRNVQGLAWDADGGLFSSEHGPTGEAGLCCHDEINEIEAGSFYGWPYRAGNSPAEPGSPPADAVAPLAESGDATWAPAGVAVHEPDGQKILYVANLRGEKLQAFELGADSVTPSTVLDEVGRIRAARFGPDECLYLTTSNRDGRGSPQDQDDRVLRVCPSA
jgi:glucose/arabinose dehydrogenase